MASRVPATSSVICTLHPLNTSNDSGRPPRLAHPSSRGSAKASTPSGGRPIGSHPSHSSAHSSVLRGPPDANHRGM